MIIVSHFEGSELAAASADYSGKVHTENHGSKCSFVRVFLSSNSRLRIWM
jgi:tetrahydromethanopterin S-methyltransferase subunit A